MRTVIVPTSLEEAINAKIAAARLKAGIGDDCWGSGDQAVIYAELLAFFDEHGVIPEFEMQRNEKGDVT